MAGVARRGDGGGLGSDLLAVRTDDPPGSVDGLTELTKLISTQGEDDEPSSLIHARDALNATGTWNNRVRRLSDALSVTKWDSDNDRKPVGREGKRREPQAKLVPVRDSLAVG